MPMGLTWGLKFITGNWIRLPLSARMTTVLVPGI
jgi:hypothetical protein